MAKSLTSDRVTAADVARSLGISRATVGFVLNNTPGQTISEVTKQRVLEEARRLGYRPHMAARALASGKSHIILLILPDWPRDFSVQSNLDEASAALDEAGYSLVTMTRRPERHAQPLWETLAPDVVLGMSPLTEDELASIRASGVQHILAPTAAETIADEMHLGFMEGPRLQVEHLVEKGRAQIAFAGSPDPRIAGLVAQRASMAETVHRGLTSRPLAAQGDLDRANVDETVSRWIAAGIDGIVAYNDEIAALTIGAIHRLGASVPGDVSVVGHDDTPLASLFFYFIVSIYCSSFFCF